MNTRAALYQKLMCQHHAAKSELKKLQEQLQASQGMSLLRHELSRHDCSDIGSEPPPALPLFLFHLAGVARDQPAVDALTARIGEVQSMILNALCLYLFVH